jgi:hypothetical protein
MKKNWTVSYFGLAQAISVAWLGLVAQQAVAQQPSTQSEQPEEVTVTGTRLITSGVNTPTPVTSVSAFDLQKMAPSTLIESLSQLPVFDNNLASQQAVGGRAAKQAKEAIHDSAGFITCVMPFIRRSKLETSRSNRARPVSVMR